MTIPFAKIMKKAHKDKINQSIFYPSAKQPRPRDVSFKQNG